MHNVDSERVLITSTENNNNNIFLKQKNINLNKGNKLIKHNSVLQS